MNEQFLSFVWKFRLYNYYLHTTNHIPVTVIKPGEQHANAGPDFFNARINIGDTLWAGNVEIHVKASDWYRHHHDTDKSYHNVILHVVYEADTEIIINNLTTLPTVELKDHINEDILKMYSSLRNSGLYIPCGDKLDKVNELTLYNWIDRMLVERLEHKSLQIELTLAVTHNDWEEAFYQLLARNFGFHINSVPFEMLSRCLPRMKLMKHKWDLMQTEALLFGQAGFLEEEFKDEYPKQMQQEYRFLRKKYGLIPLEKHLWKFLRMRPANFPTIRISQFASLMTGGSLTLSRILDEKDPETIMNELKVSASPYWSNHFIFDKITGYGKRELGISSVNNIVINTIVPCLFYFGRMRGEQGVVDKAFRWLKAVPAEENRILNEWKKNKINALNAYEGQALIGLHQVFCSKKKCLNCSLGIAILRNNESNSGQNKNRI